MINEVTQDVDKLKLFVKTMDQVVELGEKAMQDGKIDFADAMLLPSLAPILQNLYEVWDAKEELIEEAKDLNWNEIKELISQVS
tara:strand:+ start:3577 stop:3828 length:252 start_codon:yes stop_codon:yes gene_type:complete